MNTVTVPACHGRPRRCPPRRREGARRQCHCMPCTGVPCTGVRWSRCARATVFATLSSILKIDRVPYTRQHTMYRAMRRRPSWRLVRLLLVRLLLVRDTGVRLRWLRGGARFRHTRGVLELVAAADGA